MNTQMMIIVLLPILCSGGSEDPSPVEVETANLEREDEDESSPNDIETAARSTNGFDNIYGRGANGGAGVSLEFPSGSQGKDVLYERRAFYDYESEKAPFAYKAPSRHGGNEMVVSSGFGDGSGSGFRGFGALCKRRGILKNGGFYSGGEKDINLRGRFNFAGRGGLDVGAYGGINIGGRGQRGGVKFGGYGGLDFGGYGIQGQLQI